VELTYRVVFVIVVSVGMNWFEIVRLFWPSAATGFFFFFGIVQSVETFVFLWLVCFSRPL
jgi:hypothetical protein